MTSFHVADQGDGPFKAQDSDEAIGGVSRQLVEKNSLPSNETRADFDNCEILFRSQVQENFAAIKNASIQEKLMIYAKIASTIPTKTIRDVAWCFRSMAKDEIGKRRKEDKIVSRKSKGKKEKVADPSAISSSHVTNRTYDGRISYKDIGGKSGQLLEQNAQALHQISANLSSFKIHENLNLFNKARNNIQALLNDLNDEPEVMKKLPPLPVKLNEELVNLVLSGASMQKKF